SPSPSSPSEPSPPISRFQTARSATGSDVASCPATSSGQPGGSTPPTLRTSSPAIETRRHETRVADQTAQPVRGGGLARPLHRPRRQASGCETELEPRQRNLHSEGRRPARDRR